MNDIDKLAWLLIKDKKLLCARSRGQKVFYLPGGKREEGETDQEALIREIQEELSVDLVISSITFAETFKAQAHGKPDGVNVAMSCYYSNYIGELKACAEIEEIAWLDSNDKEKSSLITIIILDWLKSKGLVA